MTKNQDINQTHHRDRLYFVDNDKISRINVSVLIVDKALVWILILIVVIMFFNKSYETNAQFLVDIPFFLYIAYLINKFIFRKTDRLIQEMDSCLVYDKDGALWKINITQLNKDYKYCFTKDTFKNPITINSSRLSPEESIALNASILRAIEDFKASMHFYNAHNEHTYITKYNNISVFIRKQLSYICRYTDLNNQKKYIKIHRIYKEFCDDSVDKIIHTNHLKNKKPQNKKYYFNIVAFKVFIYSIFSIIATQISIFEILRYIMRNIDK